METLLNSVLTDIVPIGELYVPNNYKQKFLSRGTISLPLGLTSYMEARH